MIGGRGSRAAESASLYRSSFPGQHYLALDLRHLAGYQVAVPAVRGGKKMHVAFPPPSFPRIQGRRDQRWRHAFGLEVLWFRCGHPQVDCGRRPWSSSDLVALKGRPLRVGDTAIVERRESCRLQASQLVLIEAKGRGWTPPGIGRVLGMTATLFHPLRSRPELLRLRRPRRAAPKSLRTRQPPSSPGGGATVVGVTEVVAWQEVSSPPQAVPAEVREVLSSVDTLRAAWDDAIKRMSDDEFSEARRRSLRRHAIETGIIERLYDVDWGVTEALVAEGISADVAAREGGITEAALDAIATQLDGLELVADVARGDRDLSAYFIRELHVAITRHQQTYEAHDQFGTLVHPPLLLGEWKHDPNHVKRPDGSLIEYAPPEQVASEVDRLVDFFRHNTHQHPLILAAWLHHRFILIHPFQDGNGRVGRALVLLVLLRAHYAPLVVDRNNREDYIEALDLANSGDLWPLTRLFARLEISALRAEIERPALKTAVDGPPVNIAQAYVQRIVAARAQRTQELRDGTIHAAVQLRKAVADWLEAQVVPLRDAFLPVDADTFVRVYTGSPGEETGSYWRAQIVRTARALDFFSNHAEGTWWAHLKLSVMAEQLRFVVVVQRVGRGETGVLALSVFGEFVDRSNPDEPDTRSLPTEAFPVRSIDSLTFVYSEDLPRREVEVSMVLEQTLALAIDALGQRLN